MSIQSKLPHIFVDMDGVLVDFESGAIELFGISRDVFELQRQPGWNMCPALGVSMNEFWRKIDEAGAEFWSSLKPLRWKDDLLRLVNKLSSDWHLLSSPSLHPTSYTGKIDWIRTHFGGGFNKYVLTSHKRLLAKPGTVLIDDREENVEEWIRAGGWGILFPSVTNFLKEFAHDPVPEVERQIVNHLHSRLES